MKITLAAGYVSNSFKSGLILGTKIGLQISLETRRKQISGLQTNQQLLISSHFSDP